MICQISIIGKLYKPSIKANCNNQIINQKIAKPIIVNKIIVPVFLDVNVVNCKPLTTAITNKKVKVYKPKEALKESKNKPAKAAKL